MSEFINCEMAKKIREFKLPRYHELPQFDLYMDQVIYTIEGVLKPLFDENEKAILTSTMVSNYVKQKVVNPPIKKKYDQRHLAYLIVVCLLKQVFTISEICELIKIQTDYSSVDVAYDYFCTELENALKVAFEFDTSIMANTATRITDQNELLRSGVICVANNVYVKKYLEYLNKEEKTATKES